MISEYNTITITEKNRVRNKGLEASWKRYKDMREQEIDLTLTCDGSEYEDLDEHERLNGKLDNGA